MELLLLRLFTLCLLLSAQWVDGICPFQCSGHGTCVGAFCECLTGYTGVICSERTCPRNNAWIAKPFEIVDDPATGTFYAPRPQAECSNKGKCNRATGQCRCFRGFEGDACERTTCGASKCSGHGQCVPSYYLLRTKFQSYLPEPDFKYYTNWETYQNSLPEPVYKYYTNWESNQTTACVCQIGFTGPDCSYRICPKAADPYHKFTQYPTIQISIYDETGIKSGPTGPTFLFTFQGQSFAFNPRRWTMDKCRSLFQSLPNIESVNCTIVSIYGYTRTFQVVFTSFPLLPYENNLFMNDGDPNKWALDCIDTTLRRPGQTWCNIEIINTTASVPGYKFCADRGICDFSTGVCDCFLNSHGVACEQLTYVPLPPPAVVVQDLLLLNVTRRGFNGSDLSLLTTYYGDDAFNHILIEELNVTIMQLTGGGDWIMQTGGLTIKGLNNTLYAGQTIALGGLTVTGGTSVTSGGLVLSRGNLNVQGAGLAVNGGLTSASSLNLTGSIYVASGVTLGYPGLRIKNSLNVRAGGMTIALGGVTVTGGVSIASGGLLILKRGMTINNGGLVINGGLYLKGPNNLMMNSISGGLTVGGGFAVTGGITIFNVGLTVNGGATILSNGLHAKVGLTVLNSGIFTSQGLTVQDTGLYLTSGVTISGSLMIPDGIKITASGLSVSSNGLFLETTPTILNGLVTSLGGLTVVDTGVVITTGGMSVFSTGFIVSNSLTINGGLVSLGSTNIVNAGGVVTNTGLTIIAGGLQVTGGLTVKNVGLSIVTGGLSVFNNGIMISTGLTIRSAGLMLSNGLTIRAAGLRITQGLTIAQGGLNMLSGSVSIRSGGLNVASGLTLNYGGAVVATGGLSINGGLISSQALTVADIGLVVVTGGLTVADSGLIFAAGSLTINRGLVASSTVGSLSVMGSGLVVVTGGMTIPAPGLAISSGLSVMNNGLIITGGLTLSNSNLALPSGGLTNNGPVRIANGFSVQDSGVRLTGGLTLSNNGLSIVTGGLTVANNGLNVLVLTTANNGLYITGGLTVNGPGGVNRVSGGLTITAGNFFVNTASLSQGIVVQSGLSVVNGAITAGGLTVFTGGINAPTLSVNFGGLASSNAVSVRSGGLVTSNGLTVSDTGLIITNGLTIVGGGMIVPDTLRVRRGAISTDVLTVGDVGVIVTGGITIGEGGLLLTGGLTVPFANIMTGGLTVADAGFAMLGGLTITIADSGMYIEKNLTVYGGTAFNPGYTYTHASDERLKTNIHHIHNSIHKLEQIHGISYTSVDPNDHVKRRYGVIAQEVEQVLPDAIKYLKIDEKIEKKIVHPDYYHQKYSNQIDKKNDDGRYRTVNYIAILPVLVNAVKELLERAEDQNDSLPIESEDCSKEECTNEGEGSLFISTLQSFLAMEVREEDERGRREEEGLYDLLTTMIDEISCSCFLRMKSELEHLNDEVDSFQQELTMFRQSLIPG